MDCCARRKVFSSQIYQIEENLHAKLIIIKGSRNLVFFRVKWLRPAMEATSCVRRVRLRSFQGRIGSSSVFCNEWLFMRAWSLCICWLSGCRSHCNGCVKVAWRHGCVRNTFVFCSWTVWIVLEWLHQGRADDLSANFINYGGAAFPFHFPFKKCFEIVSFFGVEIFGFGAAIA